jgi:hypothetical protein
MRSRRLFIFVGLFCALLYGPTLLSSLGEKAGEGEEPEKLLLIGDVLTEARTSLQNHDFKSQNVGKIFGKSFDPLYIAVLLEVVRKDGNIESIKIFISRDGEYKVSYWETIDNNGNAESDYMALVNKLKIKQKS